MLTILYFVIAGLFGYYSIKMGYKIMLWLIIGIDVLISIPFVLATFGVGIFTGFATESPLAGFGFGTLFGAFIIPILAINIL